MKTELTPKVIISKRRLVVSILALIVCSQFLLVAIFILINSIASKEIVLLFVGLIFLAVSIIILNLRLKPDIKILKGNYIIYEDILRDKECRVSRDTDSNHTTYYFYFEKLFKLENTPIIGDQSSYYNSNTNDKFYIIRCGKLRLIFNENEFVVGDKTKITEIPQPATKKNQAPTDKKTLTKQIIKHDFLSTHGQIRTTIFFLILTTLFIFGFIMALSQESDNKIILITMFAFISLFLLFITIVKTIYVIQITSKINKDKFKISTEKIIKIGEVTFRNSNDIIKFKPESYDKYVETKKSDFPDVKEGDLCHLVFVKGENIPIQIYNARNWNKLD